MTTSNDVSKQDLEDLVEPDDFQTRSLRVSTCCAPPTSNRYSVFNVQMGEIVQWLEKLLADFDLINQVYTEAEIIKRLTKKFPDENDLKSVYNVCQQRRLTMILEHEEFTDVTIWQITLEKNKAWASYADLFVVLVCCGIMYTMERWFAETDKCFIIVYVILLFSYSCWQLWRNAFKTESILHHIATITTVEGKEFAIDQRSHCVRFHGNLNEVLCLPKEAIGHAWYERLSDSCKNFRTSILRLGVHRPIYHSKRDPSNPLSGKDLLKAIKPFRTNEYDFKSLNCQQFSIRVLSLFDSTCETDVRLTGAGDIRNNAIQASGTELPAKYYFINEAYRRPIKCCCNIPGFVWTTVEVFTFLRLLVLVLYYLGITVICDRSLGKCKNFPKHENLNLMPGDSPFSVFFYIWALGHFILRLVGNQRWCDCCVERLYKCLPQNNYMEMVQAKGHFSLGELTTGEHKIARCLGCFMGVHFMARIQENNRVKYITDEAVELTTESTEKQTCCWWFCCRASEYFCCFQRASPCCFGCGMFFVHVFWHFIVLAPLMIPLMSVKYLDNPSDWWKPWVVFVAIIVIVKFDHLLKLVCECCCECLTAKHIVRKHNKLDQPDLKQEEAVLQTKRDPAVSALVIRLQVDSPGAGCSSPSKTEKFDYNAHDEIPLDTEPFVPETLLSAEGSISLTFWEEANSPSANELQTNLSPTGGMAFETDSDLLV